VCLLCGEASSGRENQRKSLILSGIPNGIRTRVAALKGGNLAGRLLRSPWKLGPMPDGHDPDDILGDTIEEAVGSDNNFTVRESGEFGDAAAGLRELLEPTQDFFRV